MNRPGIQFLWLKIALLLLTVHTLFFLASQVYIQMSLFGDRGIAGLTRWHDWNLLFFLCAALAFEWMLWRRLSRKKPLAWKYCAIMTAALTLYLLSQYLIFFEPPFHLPFFLPFFLLSEPPFAIVFIAALAGIFGLWRHRGESFLRRRDGIQMVASIILTVSIIYLDGRFFSHANINWAVNPPLFFKRMAESMFVLPESYFMLLMCCYLLVRAASRKKMVPGAIFLR